MISKLFQEIPKILYALIVLPFLLGILARLFASVFMSGFNLIGLPL